MLSADELAYLDASFDGQVLTAGSPAYEATVRPPLVRFADARPRAIAACASPADVARALQVARDASIPFAVRSGGHCFAGRSTTTGLLLDLSPLRAVTVAGDGAVTVGTGASLGEVAAAIEPLGITIPMGLCPGVGVGGLTLGGGFGLLGRKHGLTSDRLVAARVVLADGEVVDCDDQTHGELFWALRGAGAGQVGVVTTFTFDPVPIVECTAFHLVWEVRHAVALIDAWQQWSPFAADGLAASILVSIPADLAAPPSVMLIGIFPGGETEARTDLGDFVAMAAAAPASSDFAHLSLAGARTYLAERAPQTDIGHLYAKSEFFRQPLPRELLAALVRDLVDSRTEGEARELDFTPWGGAYNRVASDASAFVQREELFLLKQTATLAAVSPRAVATAKDWLERSWQLSHTLGTGLVYPNFPDPELSDPVGAYWGSNRDRLMRVRALYDPEDVFRRS